MEVKSIVLKPEIRGVKDWNKETHIRSSIGNPMNSQQKKYNARQKDMQASNN